MGVAVILTMLVYFGLIKVWHFLVLVFVAGSGQAFGGPAYQALVPNLVKKEDVSNAVALNSIQFNLARVIGPVIAGTALASLGAVFCFGLNAISFLSVIVALYMIQTTFVPAKTKDSVLLQIKDGFSYIWSKGDLWQLTVLGFASTFCGVPLLTLLPVYARDIFGMDATGYSYMMSVSGAGSILGALLYATFSRISRQGILTLWVQVCFGILLCLFALSRSLPLSCLLLFATGLCLISLFASITSLAQLSTDDAMRGRMMSIFMLAFRGGMPLGDLMAGWLASQFSPTFALVSLGTLLIGIAVSFLISQSGVKQL
jgi:predicted MFS family arabinose efflux permease